MKITLESGGASNMIRAHAAGQVTVNQTVYTASLIVTPERIVADWRPQRFGDLAPDDFSQVVELNPEVVLIGTGARLQFPAPALTRPLVDAGIGFEVMDTGAACRTYNVLMGEGRRVVAALIVNRDSGR
jgi:uncharacterized protein